MTLFPTLVGKSDSLQEFFFIFIFFELTEAIASDAHDTQPQKRKMELSDANGGPKKKPSKQTTVIAKGQ